MRRNSSHTPPGSGSGFRPARRRRHRSPFRLLRWVREARRRRLARALTRNVRWVVEARETPPLWDSFDDDPAAFGHPGAAGRQLAGVGY
jgi:hypothetical protein